VWLVLGTQSSERVTCVGAGVAVGMAAGVAVGCGVGVGGGAAQPASAAASKAIATRHDITLADIFPLPNLVCYQ